MVRDLLTVPLRIGTAATGLATELIERAVVVGFHAAERLLKPADTEDAAEWSPPPAPTRPPVAPDVPPAPEPVPRHVSAEPTFVESFADPGAEEGPGAAVHIEEPWTGYKQMTANDVIERLVAASSAEVAATSLYE